MLFNLDLDRRLADLFGAAVTGREIVMERMPAFTHGGHTLPDRVAYTFDYEGHGQRRFVLDIQTSQQMADYLDAVPLPEVAGQIRAVLSGGEPG